jgi:hypothetical protein
METAGETPALQSLQALCPRCILSGRDPLLYRSSKERAGTNTHSTTDFVCTLKNITDFPLEQFTIYVTDCLVFLFVL